MLSEFLNVICWYILFDFVKRGNNPAKGPNPIGNDCLEGNLVGIGSLNPLKILFLMFLSPGLLLLLDFKFRCKAILNIPESKELLPILFPYILLSEIPLFEVADGVQF